MRFITLFFFIPIIPISGIKRIIECRNCRTRFQAPAELTPANATRHI